MSGHYLSGPLPVSAAYKHVAERMKDGCAILDGGVATELDRVRRESRWNAERPWGTWALHEAHAETLEVHRRFVNAGCNVISTNTWSILEVAREWSDADTTASAGMPHWTEFARSAVRLARLAIREAGREDSCAVAFCIDGDITSDAALGTLELLESTWQSEPPDLVVLETLSTVSDEALAAVSALHDTGLPVWVSLQLGRDAMAAHPDLPELLKALESRSVSAVLLNCVEPSELEGAVRMLSKLTQLPLGVYPRLGHQGAAGWDFDTSTGPQEFATLAKRFHTEGACIVGGCCGVTAPHIQAAAEALHAPLPSNVIPADLP